MDCCPDAFQAFGLIDHGPFPHPLTYLRPSLADSDIPHRTKLQKEILGRAELAEVRLKMVLQVCTGLHIPEHKLSWYRSSIVRCPSHLTPGHLTAASPICL